MGFFVGGFVGGLRAERNYRVAAGCKDTDNIYISFHDYYFFYFSHLFSK